MELDRAMSAGRTDPPEYTSRVYTLWAELTDAHVVAAFDGAPWLARIRDVWAEIRASGDYGAVVSLSPSFFVERLLDWGAHAPSGRAFRPCRSSNRWTRRERSLWPPR